MLEDSQRWQVTGLDGKTYVIEVDPSSGTLGVTRSSISAISAAAAVAFGVGKEASGGVAGAGASAVNVILTKTNAYIDDSTVVGAADVDLSALNTASITSTVVAAAVGIGGSKHHGCRRFDRGGAGRQLHGLR